MSSKTFKKIKKHFDECVMTLYPVDGLEESWWIVEKGDTESLRVMIL